MKKLFIISIGLIIFIGGGVILPAKLYAKQTAVCFTSRNFEVCSSINVIKMPLIKSNDPDSLDVEIRSNLFSEDFVHFTSTKLKVKYQVCFLSTLFSPLIFDLPPPYVSA